jgi:hypothetical protein
VVILRVRPATIVEVGPSYSIARSTVAPDDVGVTVWNAVTWLPMAVEVQVNDRPAVTSVTVQVAGESFGCTIRARDPTASGPGGSSSTLLMEAVHVGMSSTSLRTAHTRSGLAATSTDVSILRTAQPFGVSGAGERVSLLFRNNDAMEKIGS